METRKIKFPSNLHAHTFYCDGKNNPEHKVKQEKMGGEK